VHADVIVTELPQACLGLLGELLDDLDAPHPANELTEHGRLIAQAGADLQHDIVLPRLQQIGHNGDHEGLRDRLVEADR
jgi:hypothetical protein